MARLTLSRLQETLCTERLADGTAVTYAAFHPEHPRLGRLRAAMAIVDRIAERAPAGQAGLRPPFDALPGGTAFASLWTHAATRLLRVPERLPGGLVIVHANRTDIGVCEGALAERSHWDIAAALCQETALASGPIRPRRAARLRDWKRPEMPSLEQTLEGLRRFLADAPA